MVFSTYPVIPLRNKMRLFVTTILFIVGSSNVLAQLGGNGIYRVLLQPVGARQAAWGGYCNAYRDKDVTLFSQNPALLNNQMNMRGALNFNTHLKGVWTGNATLAKNMKQGTGGLQISFIDYGLMDAYDEGGNPEGKIPANETSITAGFAKEIKPRLYAGSNVKFVYSILGPYISTGAALDAGLVWKSKDSLFTAAAVIRNAGIQLLAYEPGMREPLPFSAELGVNFKPRYMPFRFNITAHNLQKPDMTYSQYLRSNAIDLSGQAAVSKAAPLGDKIFRHFTFGTELLLGKNFGILLGYNHQRRKEMAPDVRPGVAGYSWGLQFRISRIQITYASMAYFPGFNANLFTFSASPGDFQVKKPKH
ncbi:MAG: type IX secretion system protein PorQ [Sphingomonadales bacterium]